MNDQSTMDAGSTVTPADPASAHMAVEQDVSMHTADESGLDGAARALLAEKLNAISDSTDPVAELDAAISSVAEELSRRSREGEGSEAILEPQGGIGSAIETLVGVALEMDDPVAALEEGAESLAEALAERDMAARDQLRAAHEQQIDEQAAYRHARLHRVSELMDVGYHLDQAIAITNANEADIRARSVAMGRSPMETIYSYAVLNGYRGVYPTQAEPSEHGRSPMAPARRRSDGRPSAVEALAQLSDEAFSEATKGDRWHRLMRR